MLVPADVFGDVSLHNFPSLPKDANGLVVHDGDEKAECAYNMFQFVHKTNTFQPVVTSTKQARDAELEHVFAQHPELLEFEIDLKKSDNPRNNIASIYPDTIAFSALYDVMYYSDWLFKFIFRYMTRLLFLNQPYALLGAKDCIVSLSPNSNGYYNAAPTQGRAGFQALKNEMMLFKLQNKGKLDEWRAKFALYEHTADFRAQLVFDTVHVQQNGNIVQLADVTPRVLIGTSTDGAQLPPDHPGYILQLFVQTHYPKLRRAFPVYRRLETAFKLCVINCLLQGKQPDQHVQHQVVKVAQHVDSVYANGGAKAKPNILGVDLSNWTCRKAFDIGGTACAFAPGPNIEDCLEQNEKNFLDCTALEAKDKQK